MDGEHYPRHGQPGYFSLYELPQRGPLHELVYSTGWIEMDDIFKMYPGQFVVVTGKPGCGKSTFVLNLLAQLTWRHGHKHWLYVPENEPNLIDKFELIYGKTPSEYSVFAHTKVFVQSAEDKHYDAEPKTIEWVLGNAYAAWQRDNINTVVIDPWNELEAARHRDEMMHDYIGRCLRLIKRFARETGTAVIVVAHPTKSANEREVSLGDIEGSQHWFNKCDAGIIVERPIDLGPKTSKVKVAKVREQPVAGRVGHCIFNVDHATGIFREQLGGGVAY